MKNRNIFIFFLISVMFALSACSWKETNSDVKLTKKDDPKQILEEAVKMFDLETVRGTQSVLENYYDDGTIETEHTTSIVDSEKGIIYQKAEYADGTIYENYLVQEADEVYSYVKDSSHDNTWVRYKEEPGDNGETSYDYMQTLLEVPYSGEEYSDVEYSNEGIKNVDGTDILMIKITATHGKTENTTKENDEYTREAFLKDNGWTEESVRAVDGFSELLDRYVHAQNALKESAGISGTMEEECLVSLDADSHQINKIQTTAYMKGAGEDELYEEIWEAENELWARSWEVTQIQTDLDAGKSVEEALRNVEEQRDEMESLYENDGNEEDFNENYGEPAQEKVIHTQTVTVGKACPEMGNLPQKYEEITQEEYYNGY